MKNSIFWFRRDLRLQDNVGLYNALKNSDRVACVFVFDKNILSSLGKQDQRVDFIWNVVSNLKAELQDLGSDLIVVYDKPEIAMLKLAKKYKVDSVYTNEDYEPSARKRDQDISDYLSKINIKLLMYKDQAIFAKNEIMNGSGKPFTVFTPYSNQWKKKLKSSDLTEYHTEDFYDKLAQFKIEKFPSLGDLGFEKTNITNIRIGFSHNEAKVLLSNFCKNKITKYQEMRNYPSVAGVSFMGVHNRFGTVSVRELLRQALHVKKTNPASSEGVDSWVSEIIWRDFYFQILYNFPHVVYEPFNKEYESLPWENNMEFFQKWCLGETGYPIVDAAMKQLNATGYMHNRLRMVTASFLTKHLLVDYRLGEQYFASKLLDFDLSANNGGWQWSASTGCDAQPYFRIFNPSLQSEKFDPDGSFIKKFLPIFKDVESNCLHEPWGYVNELKSRGVILGIDYPMPIVDHKVSRAKTLEIFKVINQK